MIDGQGIIVEAGLLLPLHHPSSVQISISRISTGLCDRLSIPMTTSVVQCKLRRLFITIQHPPVYWCEITFLFPAKVG